MQLRWTARTSALAPLLLLAHGVASPGFASTRPQYGGTLRVELCSAPVEADPRKWKTGSQEFATGAHIASLLFDRLVSLDNYGRFQPRLAVEWSHDASFKRWQFKLRSGVKFSDGTALSPADVVASLQHAFSPSVQMMPFANSVVFQSPTPIPDLLEQLASGRSFVFHQTADNVWAGSGPFALVPAVSAETGSQADPARSGGLTKLRFRASEQTWAGRLFVDHLEITFGVPPLRALFDLQLGKADMVLLAPEVVRRAAQSGVRLWSSTPLTLYLLRFDETSGAANDPRLREALSLSLDRHTMAGVLLQKQADPAASLLPQWLSGYALLFDMEMNLERARELRQSLPVTVASIGNPLLIRVEASGDLPRLVAERVGVNTRQAGFFLQTASRSESPEGLAAKPAAPRSSLRLVTWRYTSLSPRAELESMMSSLHLGNADATNPARDLEQLAGIEQRLLDDREVLPLVALPDYIALSPSVRDWTPAPWGEWRLADVWIDRSEKAPAAISPPDEIASPAGARP
jgi:ABC-type transport system substrate-binding protein